VTARLTHLVHGRSQQQLTLLVVCSALFFNVLNGTMVNIALPAIGRDFGLEPARLGWIATGYLLVFGVAVPFYGRLADRFGARRLFVIGLCVYSVSSLGCAIAPSYPLLLAGRIAQASGAASIAGLGMAIISGVYPPERRGSALGYVSATVGSGAAVGPIVGGTITGLLNWHAMFLLSALSGLIVPVAMRVLPPSERRPGEGIDLLGGVLLGLGVGGALLAATEGVRGDATAPVVLGAAAVSLVAFLLLVLRQRLTTSPFVPRALLHNGRFIALVVVSFCAMTANVATFVSLPLLLNRDYNLSEVQIGFVLLPNALAVATLGPVAGRLVDRIGGRLPLRVGLVVILVAQLTFSSVGVGNAVWLVSLLSAIQGVGFALMNSPIATMVSLAVGRDHQSSGLSMNSMAFFLGGGFGTAMLTAILTLRASAGNALNPLYAHDAIPYSDAFLIFSVPLLLALTLSLRLPSEEQQDEERIQAPTNSPARATAR